MRSASSATITSASVMPSINQKLRIPLPSADRNFTSFVLLLALGPHRAEYAAGEEAVDQSVEHVLHGGGPLALVPDGVLKLRHRVAQKRGAAREAEHGQVGRTRGQRRGRDIPGDEAHDETIDE